MLHFDNVILKDLIPTIVHIVFKIQSQLSKQQAIPAAQLRQDYVPIASSDPAISASTIARNVLNG